MIDQREKSNPMTTDDDKRRCEDCDGKGYDSTPCVYCHGTGMVETYAARQRRLATPAQPAPGTGDIELATPSGTKEGDLIFAYTKPLDGGGEWFWRQITGRFKVFNEQAEQVATAESEEDAAQIVADHNAAGKMVAALREVEAMLNKELARDYESQPWAKQVRAALMGYDAALAVATSNPVKQGT